MGLREEVLKDSKTKKVNEALTDLSVTDRNLWKEFCELLVDSSVPSAPIARAFQKRGYQISERTVQRYRKDFNV